MASKFGYSSWYGVDFLRLNWQIESTSKVYVAQNAHLKALFIEGNHEFSGLRLIQVVLL